MSLEFEEGLGWRSESGNQRLGGGSTTELDEITKEASD